MSHQVAFSTEDVKLLRTNYDKAVETGLEQFTTQVGEHEEQLLTSYAKYMLEYLEPLMARNITRNK